MPETECCERLLLAVSCLSLPGVRTPFLTPRYFDSLFFL